VGDRDGYGKLAGLDGAGLMCAAAYAAFMVCYKCAGSV